MKNDTDNLCLLIKGMRDAYFKGENAMEYARSQLGNCGEDDVNDIIATLIAYDLQSGSYVDYIRKNPQYYEQWSKQLSEILAPLMDNECSVLEVGCGEATTLAGILTHLRCQLNTALGFDISLSRIHHGNKYLEEMDIKAKLFVGDLFSIPLMSNSIDIVYSSHSLEPNGGKEAEAIAELLRVSRKWVVLIEPMYEFASEEARKRMEKHGYVKDLRRAAELCGAKVVNHCLLAYSSNPLNPSGLLLLEKHNVKLPIKSNKWICPITGTPLIDDGDVFISEDTGLVYPVLRGIPMLRAEHAIVASALKKHF